MAFPDWDENDEYLEEMRIKWQLDEACEIKEKARKGYTVEQLQEEYKNSVNYMPGNIRRMHEEVTKPKQSLGDMLDNTKVGLVSSRTYLCIVLIVLGVAILLGLIFGFGK